MMDLEAFGQAILIGIGGTAVLDLWALALDRILKIPAPNWSMVGRWIGNMPRGRFSHSSMGAAPPVAGEAAIGWTAHYVIGAGYGLLLVAIFGAQWLEQPTLPPALVVAWVLLIAPFFIMMPGMGSGIAASRTPRPNAARLKSVVSHTIFGLGMYLTALLLAAGMSQGLAG